MVSKAYVDQMVTRQNFRNLWHTDLTNTIRADCPFCCVSLACGPCVSYHLRKRALYNDMSRYICCAGYLPCSGQCGEQKCPEFCLATEVFCCFANSVATTRFLLQDEFSIQTTKCDNCIIGFMFCLQQVACIFSLVAVIAGSDEVEAASQILTCASDVVWCSVCACMQTQHKIQMDKRDGVFGDPPMQPPPPMVMSRFDQPIPPAIGYPPTYPPPGSYPPNYIPPGQHAVYAAPTALYPPNYGPGQGVPYPPGQGAAYGPGTGYGQPPVQYPAFNR